jgi:hypothetical protein
MKDEVQVDDGVIYYLPKRPIKVTITLPSANTQPGNNNKQPAADAGKKNEQPAAKGSGDTSTQAAPTITVDTIDSVPDPSKRFILSYSGLNRNMIGDNHASIKVTPSGLLTSAGSNTISGIITIVQSVAKSLGTVSGALTAGGTVGLKEGEGGERNPCLPGVPYSVLVYPEDVAENDPTKAPALCKNYSMQVLSINGETLTSTHKSTSDETKSSSDTKNTGGDTVSSQTANTAKLVEKKSHSGVFYKQDIPYQVVITDSSGNMSTFIAYSPDLSPVGFAPIPLSFFANANISLTFVNGVLTGVDSDVKGEIAGLVELPADFISAYTTALGGIFSGIGTALGNEKTVATNRNLLTQVQAQKQICADAISANTPAILPSAFAGKKDADLTTALAALTAAWTSIKGACGS